MADKPANPNVVEMLDKAVRDPEIPKVYANGFSCALGIGDLSILLQRNGVPIEVLNLSYTVAKTLSIKLNDLISILEGRSEKPIMSTEDVEKFLK